MARNGNIVEEIGCIAALRFGTTYLTEIGYGRETNRRITEKIQREVKQRRLNTNGTTHAQVKGEQEDWKMFQNKITRLRPRLLGAVAAYSLLSGLTHQEIVKNGGTEMFRLMWFLGSSQDDLIDEISKEEMQKLNNITTRKNRIRREIFGKERVFYQSGYTIIMQTLNESTILYSENKRYLKEKLAEWYRFLIEQEAEVCTTDISQMNFEYCKRYREEQNAKIGSVLVACLNGKMCLDHRLRELEMRVPILSFRTQIIDDIADIREDLQNVRPSYAVGALVDNFREMDQVSKFLAKNPQVVKCTPGLLRKLAPKSFARVKETYDSYAKELTNYGRNGEFLIQIGDPLFYVFPIYRDLMYRINPNYANF